MEGAQQFLVHRNSEIHPDRGCRILYQGSVFLHWTCSLLLLVLLSGFWYFPLNDSPFHVRKHDFFLFIKAQGPEKLFIYCILSLLVQGNDASIIIITLKVVKFAFINLQPIPLDKIHIHTSLRESLSVLFPARLLCDSL